MSVDVGFLAPEFPNDNPALHGGVIWVCLEPTAKPTPELVPRREPTVVARMSAEVVNESDDEGFLVEELTPIAPTVMVVEELAPCTLVAAVAPVEPIVVFESVAPPSIDANESSAPPPSDDPFMTLVCTLADVAIAAGSPSIASLLPGLLFDGRLPDALDEDAAAMLKAAGIWNGESVEPQFVATVNAWRGILRGTSEDFSACGSMLDEWASELLARLLDTQAAAPRLRQELRTRGVAAFGLAA